MKFTKQHYIIFLILITEVLGFSLILPFLPFLAQDLGTILGLANSLDSLANIVGPVLGGALLSSIFPNSFIIITIASLGICLALILREEKQF